MAAFAFTGSRPDLARLSIDGERVRLVAISSEWEEEIFREFTPEIVVYMLPKPPDTIEETRAFIRSSVAGHALGDNIQLVITDKATGEFLGCCGLHGRIDPGNPELGIWLKKTAHGRGLGREAIRTLALWAQERIELQSLLYPVDKRNEPSRRIPESLGGRPVGERTETGASGNVLHEVVYRIELPLGDGSGE